jgi:hypothetical protein
LVFSTGLAFQDFQCYHDPNPLWIGATVYWRLDYTEKFFDLTNYQLICATGYHPDSDNVDCVIDVPDPNNPNGNLNVDQLLAAIASLELAQAENATLIQQLLAVQAEPFDLNFALAAFSFFFSSTILLWVVAKAGGVVLSAIRKG